MKQQSLIITAAVCLAGLLPIWATGTFAAEPARAEVDSVQASSNVSAPSPGTSLSTMSETRAEKLSPMNREMREVLLREKTDLELLCTRMAALSDQLAALDLQREISDRKFQTQVELLEVQGRFAREDGRIEMAEEAENAVAALKARQEARQVARISKQGER